LRKSSRHGRVDDLFGGGPFEHGPQSIDLLVDVVARPIKFVNHPLAKLVQSNRAEVRCQGGAVMATQEAKHVINHTGFPRDPAVFPVVFLSVSAIHQDELVDGDG
jgi:hypothetical protein